MDDFVDYICHLSLQPNVVFNPVLYAIKPGVEWINYHPSPSTEADLNRTIADALNKHGLETWESFSIKYGQEIAIRKIGAGNFGFCYMIHGIRGMFKDMRVVFKVAYIRKTFAITDVDTREIRIGKQMSMMCLGSGRRKTPLASPYIVRVYGSIDTQFVTPTFWKFMRENPVAQFMKERTTSHTCMLLEHIQKFVFKVPRLTITNDMGWDLTTDAGWALGSPRACNELFHMVQNNPELCRKGWVIYILFQVLITIAIFGRRFRHNDIHTSNIMITPYHGPPLAFEFKVSKQKSLYFKIPYHFNFQVKIHDFGYTVDLTRGYELDREILKNIYSCGGDEVQLKKSRQMTIEWRKSFGLESIHSQYYDPYLFLWWANEGLKKTRTAPVGECAPFNDFMDRLGMNRFPAIAKDKEGRLTSEMQTEADATGSYKGFEMFTAIEILQDEYFTPYRITQEEFKSLPSSQKIYIPFMYDENVPEVDMAACRSHLEPVIKNPSCGKTLLGTPVRTDLSVYLTTAYVPHS